MLASPNGMSPTGSGPKIMLVASPFLVGAIAALIWRPQLLRIGAAPSAALATAGAVLLALGLVFYGSAIITFVKQFPAGRLITTGPYALCRHPIYASVSLFILPAVGLLARSWAFFGVAMVMLLASKHFVREEDAALEGAFGAEYRLYRARVPEFLPIPLPRPPQRVGGGARRA